MASKKSQPAKPNYQGSLADYKASMKKTGNSTPGPIISAPTVYQAKNVVQNTGKVIKDAAVDVGLMAAGAGVGRILGKIAGSAAGRKVAQEVFEALSPKTMGTGGKVYRTNSPMGPTLASTKIMTKGQTSAAASGLTKIASNRANEVGAQIGSKVSKGVKTSVRTASIAAAAATTPKNKKDTRRR